jgi:EAL domain-containing protein (putative c-di-GMP-specific phosphodiesterase class I)
VRIAVNLSGAQLKHSGFIGSVEAVLAETGLDSHYLELELTESMIMEDGGNTGMLLNDLKILGIDLAVDDFGTGYSSLSYLKNLPIGSIKIAQNFVKNIPANADDAAIIKAIIGVGRSLNLKVIAEGVETREQLEYLASLDCHAMQGFYFARPATAEEMTEYFRDGLASGNVCPFKLGAPSNPRQGDSRSRNSGTTPTGLRGC